MIAGDIDVDTAIVAADPLCQQALECQAEDMAMEDTLYALERALTDGHLPADTYLKQVCRSCRHAGSLVACCVGLCANVRNNAAYAVLLQLPTGHQQRLPGLFFIHRSSTHCWWY